MALVAVVLIWTAFASSLFAQFKEPAPSEPEPGREVIQKWRMGMVVTADGGGFRGIKGTVAVPMDWPPEQRVRVLQEDLSPEVAVDYRTIKDVARQMNVTIPGLRDGEEAKAIVTFEIRRSLQAAPDETGGFVRPNARRLDSKQAGYLRPSPYIESTDAAIVEAAKTIGADKETAWAQVEAIYDWVREKVTFKDNRGGTVKGAVDTLRDGVGDCDERTSLFIALCRAKGIPARTVRVPGHCYPEFCLLDPNGAGRWFPCQAAGTRAFGAMPDPRPILQKGDNVASLDPRTKKKTQVRFLPETLVGLPAGGGGRLRLKLVCERLDE
jgi:hypothetical protein